MAVAVVPSSVHVAGVRLAPGSVLRDAVQLLADLHGEHLIEDSSRNSLVGVSLRSLLGL